LKRYNFLTDQDRGETNVGGEKTFLKLYGTGR